MNESFISNTEEKILIYEISDPALEIAAGFTKDMMGSLTIAYCTFDFCNAIGPKRTRRSATAFEGKDGVIGRQLVDS